MSEQELSKVLFPRLSPLGLFIMRVIQTIAACYRLRGLPRLVWLGRRIFFGHGLKIAEFQNRFRVVCNCDSYDSLMTVSGFVLRAMDRVLNDLIQNIGGDVITFIDIGANVGFVSLLACSNSENESRVHAYCFEPDPRAFQLLVINSRLNKYKMNLQHLALGAIPGQGFLNLASESLRSTLLPEPPGGFPFVKTIGRHHAEVNTLDDFCRRESITPQIIKVDVEGFEPYVLQGALNVVRENLPFIIFEINPAALAIDNNSPDSLLDLVSKLGYRLFHIDYKQAGLTKKQINKRNNWRGYIEILHNDQEKGFLFDVIAVPEKRLKGEII